MRKDREDIVDLIVRVLFMPPPGIFKLTYELTYPAEKLHRIQYFSVKSFSMLKWELFESEDMNFKEPA